MENQKEINTENINWEMPIINMFPHKINWICYYV
jgi:hypothetical protein